MIVIAIAIAGVWDRIAEAYEALKDMEAKERTLYAEAGAADEGKRLDVFLARVWRGEGVSRARLQNLMAAGALKLADGKEASHPAAKIHRGEKYRLVLPEPAAVRPQPEEIKLAVVYEDEDLIVIDKPAGLVVHPAPGHRRGTLVNALIAHCGGALEGVGDEARPGIVHRLDKDTSGLMLAAKTHKAFLGLQAQFAGRGEANGLQRVYLALAAGAPAEEEGEISAPIGRHKIHRKQMAVVESGRMGRTHWRCLARLAGGGASVLRCRIFTGRTHQVRVHLAYIGHPVLGDPLYGGRWKKCPPLTRQALHAHRLDFIHPARGEGFSFTSPLPDDIAALLKAAKKAPSLLALARE